MNKLLEILGSSKLLLTETEESREYYITEIEKYIEIRSITIDIKRTYTHSYSHCYHGVIIIPLKEPVEICGEVPNVRGRIDDLFILVLNRLIDTWLLKEQHEFIPKFIKVLEDNKIIYTISNGGIFYFNNGFEFSSLTRTFNDDIRIPTTMGLEEVLKRMEELIKSDSIRKWKTNEQKGLEKYTIILDKH